ncbi:MAG: nitrate reductase molybdenum cofactor assembly chaperone [Candidatus Accumulibacter sp.]|nr:nitrate reductase molybdenum cofactor assembly chaperone [Accumulibacter sp.]
MNGLIPASTAARTLRALSRLLSYPTGDTLRHLSVIADTLRDEQALGAASLCQLQTLLDRLAATPALELEADYVECFDRGRSTSLHLFEHVHGDSRERGPAMIDLAQTYASAGLYLADDELPDYLPAALEFASTLAPSQASEFVGEMTHILNAIHAALVERHSDYASLFAALLELAGTTAQPVAAVAEPPVDSVWDEPPAFTGCSSLGQSRPVQPIHVVRSSAPRGVYK